MLHGAIPTIRLREVLHGAIPIIRLREVLHGAIPTIRARYGHVYTLCVHLTQTVYVDLFCRQSHGEVMRWIVPSGRSEGGEGEGEGGVGAGGGAGAGAGGVDASRNRTESAGLAADGPLANGVPTV